MADGGISNGKKAASVAPSAVMAMTDISTLSVIPIRADRMNMHSSGDQSLGREKSNDDAMIRLLPKLFNATFDNKSESDNNKAYDNENSSLTQSIHPSRELVRITHALEVQLKERLRDASDGAMQRSDDRKADELTQLSSSEIQEEFLLRSEAILHELLSAVQQQLRKEQSQRSGGGNRQNKKRKAPGQATNNGSSLASPPLNYYSALVRQLQVLHVQPNVTDISLHKNTSNDTNGNSNAADLTTVSITCLDGNTRSHTWHAELYPSIVLTMDLPSEFALEDTSIRLEKWWEQDGADTTNNSQSVGLPRIHHHFEQALHKYQPLFDELDDLDSHLWILEPSLPARRCSVERRIALWEGGASMVIVLDPENVRGIPVMVRFLGVTMATMTAAANAAAAGQGGDGSSAGGVVDWRTSFADFVAEDGGGEDKKHNSSKQSLSDKEPTKHKRWSEERSIRENLELWFGSPLPSPLSPSTDKSDFLVECGICYTHRLPTEDSTTEEGPLPEAKCSNASCNRHYHESCLFEWLHALPTARVSFDRIFGSCPYCCESVSVKILNGTNTH